MTQFWEYAIPGWGGIQIAKNLSTQLRGQDADWITGATDGDSRARDGVANYAPVHKPTELKKPIDNGGNEDWNQIVDYNGGGTGGGSGAGGSAAERAAAAGQWQDQIDWINQQIAGLGGYEGTGKNQLQDSYNKGLSRLNEQQSGALSKYATQRGDTRGDFENVGTDIDASARNNYTALMSLLGRAGAGSSSAASVLTPYAVSQVASKSRGDAANTYGRNLRDLETAETETKQSYENNKRDLDDQKRTNEFNLARGIGSQRQELQNKLAEAQANLELSRTGDYAKAREAAAGAIAGRNSTAQALSTLLDQYRNPYAVKDVNVKAATMANYADNSQGVKVDDPNGTGTDTDTSADYLAQIRAEEERKKKDEQAT